jgi:hypothetical protein
MAIVNDKNAKAINAKNLARRNSTRHPAEGTNPCIQWRAVSLRSGVKCFIPPIVGIPQLYNPIDVI